MNEFVVYYYHMVMEEGEIGILGLWFRALCFRREGRRLFFYYIDRTTIFNF